MRMGMIVRVVEDRGFGFLRDDETGREYFFHKTSVLPSRHDFDRMRHGVPVEFEIDDTSDKLRAATVTIIHAAR